MSEHSNWFCSVKWESRLRRVLAKLHDPYCDCQVEPWNRYSKAQLRDLRREERRARRNV